MPRLISAHYGYGVDLVEVHGDFSAGYGHAEAAAPSAQVNGQTVGVMNLMLRGESAVKLNAAMKVATTSKSTSVGSVRTSQDGRIECATYPDATVWCTISNVVGFASKSGV